MYNDSCLWWISSKFGDVSHTTVDHGVINSRITLRNKFVKENRKSSTISIINAILTFHEEHDEKIGVAH